MNRRKFIGGTGTTLAAAMGLDAVIPSEARSNNSNASIPSQPLSNTNDVTPQPIVTATNDLTPYTGPWGDTQIWHILRRAMFGVPIPQFVAAKALGSMNALVTQLLTEPAMPAPFASWLNTINTAANTGTGQSVTRLNAYQVQSVVNWWFDKMLSEDLSIREKMTLMWSNHFVIGTSTVKNPQYTFVYNQTLRANALGNFKTFVNAISIDPAMLLYLNGNQNTYYTKNNKTINNINENYARELQELFTIGLNDPKSPANDPTPNYTESDIQAAAKALSGWQPTTSSPFVGQFNQNLHYPGTETFPSYNETNVSYKLADVIDMILSKGTTTDGKNNLGYNVAYFVSAKIYEMFVYFVPNPQVVDAMANLLVASNWEIKPVMQALLSSAHFYDASVIGAQIKSPVEYIAGILRDFSMTLPTFDPSNPPQNGSDSNGNLYKDPNPTHSYLTTGIIGTALGQQLLNPPNVKGWPGGQNWVSTGTFTDRQSIAAVLGTYPNPLDGSAKVKGAKVTFDPVAWANSYPGFNGMTSHQIAAALESATLSFVLGPNETASMYLAINPLSVQESDFALTETNGSLFAIALMLLPEYQLV